MKKQFLFVLVLTCILQITSMAQVVIYSNANYTGSSKTFSVAEGSYNNFGIGNDAISSIKIVGDRQVTLYKDFNYRGVSYSISASQPNLTALVAAGLSTPINFNDCVSSIKITGTGIGSVTIFENANYAGQSQIFRALGNYNDFGIGNDAISSIKVPSGWNVILYENKDYTGVSSIALESKNNFATISRPGGAIGTTINDWVSAIKIIRAPASSSGALDISFNVTSPSLGFVNTLSQQSEQIILGAVGVFRLNSGGGVDASFNTGLSGANSSVTCSAVQSDGKIIIGGDFTSYNGTPQNRLARLNADGTLDAGFNMGGTGADASISSIIIQGDGKIVIGGSFTTFNGVPRYRLARLNSDGTLDISFLQFSNGSLDVLLINSIRAMALQGDGKIIIGGHFNDIPTANVARVNTDGSLDNTFIGSGTDNAVSCIAIQRDGKIIIGGDFARYNGVSRNQIARLNNDGSIDATFSSGTGVSGSTIGSSISSLVIQNDNKVIVGGRFSAYNGVSRNCIARLNPAGTVDITFNPGLGARASSANPKIHSMLLQSDGKIIIGGEFDYYNGTPCHNIARILP